MVSRIRVVALVALLGIFAIPASSQAIVEYGKIASGTATTVAKTGALEKPLKAVGEALGTKASQSQSKGISDTGKPRTNVPPVAVVMQGNKQRLESAAGVNGATLHVASVPTQAVISVDGFPVAYAPADIRLAAGKHLIEVRRQGFLAWRTQVVLKGGETVRLEPKLAADPKQVVVSFR